MVQTYLFSKETRDEHFDTDTSYAFRLRIGRGWLHLNKKATKVIRQERCNDLQEFYYFLKNIKDD